ncbi:AbrB/MazE/SpoVT family DNA-binding domain-containing protein [Gordonia aichiensis]|uniref:AbrB/MazE/SpoVT family DNA-binding domain-containing protein n=1 Tax=Gordonia aichiensis TaxID=36820 RepID=UPI00058D827B|nr:AbrB/MazE/SpoVT family DNA-binding domain-containing protein [Gordonia aichiensis]
MSATVVLGKQGRLVVPADLRSELDLREGDVLSVQRVGDRLVIERPADALRSLRGALAARSRGRSLVEALLAERLAEVESGT